jgi:hypothetical protein
LQPISKDVWFDEPAHSYKIALLIAEAYDYAKSDNAQQSSGTMSSGQHQIEFRTFKYAVARQMGHSTAALRVLAANKDAVVFYRSHSNKDGARILLSKHIEEQSIRSVWERMLLLDSNKDLTIAKQTVNDNSIIIFDNASLPQQSAAVRHVVDLFPNARLIVELQ